MQEKSLIQYGSITEYEEVPSVKVVPHKGKRKSKSHFIRNIFIIALTIILLRYLYTHNDYIRTGVNNMGGGIKNFFYSLFVKNEGEENDNTDTNENQENTTTPPDESGDNIPSDATDDDMGKYKISEKNLTYINKFYNETNYSFDLSSLSYIRPNINEIYSVYGYDAPVVLILHSNAAECYSNGKSYSTDDNFYSNEKNVAALGRAMSEILTLNGINAIHIENVFANGSIHSSGKEYKAFVEGVLKEYPSITYVFDISRDMLINSDLSMTKPVFTYNEKKCAQIKLTIGSDAISENKNWKGNLAFASLLSSFSSEKAESLIYNYNLSNFALNQNINAISLRINIGAFSNTYEEAYESTLLFTNMLVEFLK